MIFITKTNNIWGCHAERSEECQWRAMTVGYNDRRSTAEHSNPTMPLNVYYTTGRNKSPLCRVIVSRVSAYSCPFNARKDGSFHVAEAKPENSSFFIEASPVWWAGWWSRAGGCHFRGVIVYC